MHSLQVTFGILLEGSFQGFWFGVLGGSGSKVGLRV